MKTHNSQFIIHNSKLPKLRFPEFLEAGEWEEKKLGEVCEINPSNGGELPESFIYIELESVVAGELLSENKICREGAPSRAQRLLKRGDIIYQIVRPYQRNNFFFDFDDTEIYVASTGYAQLRAFAVSSFLYQVVHTDTFVNKVIAKCTGSSYPAINSSDLAEIELAIPEPSEQQKIAACLSSLDARISAESQKLAALKTHKKGLMQQLFPAEGETVPRLRFAGFEGEWDTSTLDKVCERISVGLATSVTQHYRNIGVPIIRNLNIKDGYFDSSDMLYISEEFAKANLSKAAKALDVLTVHTGSNLGQTCVLPSNFHNCQTFITLITTPKKVILDPYFLCIHMSSEIGRNEMTKLQVGGGKGNLNTSDLKRYRITFPSLPEQQKIAACLSSLNELITAQSQKIEKLKEHKKGLMQQLFPSEL